MACTLGGCATSPAPVVQASLPLICGDRQAALDFDGDAMWLHVGEQRWPLRAVPAASGARYQAVGDPGVVLWNKGSQALIELRGDTWPACRFGGSLPVPWRALGNEPGWALHIFGPRLRFTRDDGRLRTDGLAPEPARDAGGALSYRAATELGTLHARITPKLCSDTMSGMPFPDSVRVEIAGQVFDGCGGDPAALLQGAEWVVEEIGNAGIVDRSRVTLQFGADGQLSGRASCNRYTGSYRLTGEALHIGPTASTRMACPPALMNQEQRFLDALASVQRHAFGTDGALQLFGPAGRVLLARRA